MTASKKLGVPVKTPSKSPLRSRPNTFSTSAGMNRTSSDTRSSNKRSLCFAMISSRLCRTRGEISASRLLNTIAVSIGWDTNVSRRTLRKLRHTTSKFA